MNVRIHRNAHSAQMTDMQARAIAGLGAEVFVNQGQLMIRAVSPIPAPYRGFALHPDDKRDPYVFRIDLSRFGLGTLPCTSVREEAERCGLPVRLAPSPRARLSQRASAVT